VTGSPIEQLLEALDKLDVDATAALFAPDARLLCVDGRRADGQEAISEFLGELFAQLRSMSHRITAAWNPDDVWIAELEASYELQDRLRMDAVPRALVLHHGADGITELHAYGANEPELADRHSHSEGMRIGGRWMPPL
jgi:uncharacterized protein (TIGR02246 family)